MCVLGDLSPLHREWWYVVKIKLLVLIVKALSSGLYKRHTWGNLFSGLLNWNSIWDSWGMFFLLQSSVLFLFSLEYRLRFSPRTFSGVDPGLNCGSYNKWNVATLNSHRGAISCWHREAFWRRWISVFYCLNICESVACAYWIGRENGKETSCCLHFNDFSLCGNEIYARHNKWKLVVASSTTAVHPTQL